MAPLNCIVDDSALVASVKSNAAHSIVPWINQGAINVFVPLYALERLARLARIHCPVSNDAGKALRWLDQVTSWTEHKIAGRVKLQEPDDQYHSWDDVEQYLLPDTPLTSNTGPQRVDRLSKMLDNTLNINGQQSAKQSPNTSPISTSSSLSSSAIPDGDTPEDETSTTLSAHGVHPQVRPLLNFTVWCTHHGGGTSGPSGKYILVTNDHIIQKQAGKFGVRAKLLSQLQNVLAKEAPLAAPPDAIQTMQNGDGATDGVDEDEDEVVFDPSARPGSSRGPKTPPSVIDPNHFGRSPKMRPRGSSSAERSNGRGGRGAGRGRASGNRARGGNNFTASSSRSPPSGPSAQRGSGRGRGGTAPTRGANQQIPRQIDPDSFVRPAHMGRRGRGGFHKLWDPTSSG